MLINDGFIVCANNAMSFSEWFAEIVILILAAPLATVGYRMAGARMPRLRSFAETFKVSNSSPMINGIIAP